MTEPQLEGGTAPGSGAGADGRVTAKDTPAEVLAKWGPRAGLAANLAPFCADDDGLTLAERLARTPFLMAPMAGVTDSAYRMMARAGGAALAYSEMVSCAGLHYGGEKSWELVDTACGEPDLAVQLFGTKPELFREAAAGVAERLGGRLVLVDINMACPVPKVTRKGEGSALMDDPALAAQLVRAVAAEVDVPVTVKIRRGRTAGHEVAPEFARVMEDAGAAAVAVHGRSATQMYRGEADWGCVRRVVDAVSVPVIGSGDVDGAEEACRMLDETGATAVMLARGSYGDPWAFGNARALRVGAAPHEVTPEERLAAFECHVRLLEATGAHLKRARSLATWYLRGIPEAAWWRGRAMQCSTASEFLGLAAELRESLVTGRMPAAFDGASASAAAPIAEGASLSPGAPGGASLSPEAPCAAGLSSDAPDDDARS